MDTVTEFHIKAPQAIASEGLSTGPYVVARAGCEPTTLRTKGDESTNVQPCPTIESAVERSKEVKLPGS